jgi:DNA-binding XRE family transcriptional regulator
MTPETLGTRIKAVRTAWDWSQEQFAHALQVDQASISLWERDRIVPSGSATVALACLFGCSIRALVVGEGWAVPADPPAGEAWAHLEGFARRKAA